MDQLRRQARALHRAAAAGHGDAVRRLQAVSLQPTLAAAQLALAREYGYLSWARLEAQVERRRSSIRASYVIRPVISLDDLLRKRDGRIAGGLLACRRGAGVTTRAIALEPGAPRDEVMTRLLQTLEIEARRLGVDEIFEGGVGDRAWRGIEAKEELRDQ